MVEGFGGALNVGLCQVIGVDMYVCLKTSRRRYLAKVGGEVESNGKRSGKRE